MTDKDKARLAELEAKDYLVDDEDVIDYYRLSCEKLDEENEKLTKAIKLIYSCVPRIEDFKWNEETQYYEAEDEEGIEYCLTKKEYNLLKEVLE